MTDDARPLETLSDAELDAVAKLWRRERRQLATSFTGTSMLPAIASGQSVVVDCGAEPAVGEVAVFHFDNRVGVHRVVARGPDWLLTWGDANPLPDQPIELSRLIGTIRGVAAAPRSRRRALLLRWLLASPGTVERLSARVRFLYRARSAWSRGPTVFSAKVARAIVRSVRRH